MLFDPAQNDKPNAAFIQSLSNEQLKLIGNNHSNFIAFEQNGDDVLSALPNYKVLGDAGANVVVFGMNGMNQYCPAGANVSGAAHVGILQYGFNRGILSYLAGDIPLEKVLDVNYNKMTIYQYDLVTHNFKEVPISNVSGYIESILGSFSNFNSVGEYYSNVDFSNLDGAITNLKNINDFETITSDQEFIASILNPIRSAIKATSLLSNFKNLNIKSTTSVPTCAENFLYDYYSSVFELLNKLEQETQNAFNIGDVIIQQDKELERVIDINM